MLYMKNIYELHGGDVYRQNVKYDFSVNVNPLPMPKKMKRNIVKAMDTVNHYPDPYNEALCKEIANMHGLDWTNVIIGNGAAELLYAMGYVLSSKANGKSYKALTLAPSFLEYEKAVEASGGEITTYSLIKENGFMLTNNFLTEIKKGYDIVFLCNPNNPTGKRINKELLIEIIKECQNKGTYLCLDECFLPFARAESMDSMMKDNDHLILLRSFTKLYAIPGIRVGYALCNSELCKQLKTKMQPWNVSNLASAAALAALNELDYVKKSLAYIDVEKEYLLTSFKEFETKGYLKIYGYDANFIFFEDLSKKMKLHQFLRKKKINIRNANTFTSLTDEHFYRISIQTHDANKKLVQFMEKYYG